ncbi:MAG: PIG-L family deacetylase [Chloroflexi bacterium]|nr:PIG-L family deacetylase [Chloroflexota bacterium]
MEIIERPQRAMVVFAHPDDEIGCAGTIAAWVKQGTEVCLVLCTNGNKGTEDLDMPPDQLAQVRAREQQDAAATLGVKDLVMLGYPDGGLEDTPEFRGKLVQEIRRFRPQVVLTHAPMTTLRHSHRDHRTTGAVALDAVFPYARDPWHYAELTKAGLQPHKVGTVLLWGSDNPDVFSDITETMDQKVQAMMCHRSQFARPNRDPNRQPGDFMREGARRQGERAGLQYAEAFHKLEFRT